MGLFGTTFLEAIWLLIIASVWITIIAVIVMVLVDNFRHESRSGWAKAGWTLFVILFPLLGVVVYQITQPSTVSTQRSWDTRRRDEAMMPR